MSIQPGDNPFPITVNYTAAGQISTVTSYNCQPWTPCAVATLKFIYSGAHIISVSDNIGATWLYGYNPPLIAGLVCSSNPLIKCSSPNRLVQSGTGLLQTVTLPSATLPSSSVHGTLLFSYGPQKFAGKDFAPTNGNSILTGYGVITSASPPAPTKGLPTAQTDVTEAILGLFNYALSQQSSLPVVSEAGSGWSEANSFVT